MILPQDVIVHHIDLIFNISSAPYLKNLDYTYSRKTGKIKSFGAKGALYGTFRSDGGIALTLAGAVALMPASKFYRNYIIPMPEVIQFIRESKSLFCKHVLFAGSNICVGSEAVIVDENDNILAVGKSLTTSCWLNSNQSRGIAVRIREGLKGRETKELI